MAKALIVGEGIGGLTTALSLSELGIELEVFESVPRLEESLVEARAPHGFDQVRDVISSAELEAIAAKYKRLAGCSIDEIEQRPSLAQAQY